MAWQAAKYFYITIHKTSKNKIYKSRHKPEKPANSKGLVKTKQANQEIVTHEESLAGHDFQLKKCSIKNWQAWISMGWPGLTRNQEADPTHLY